MTQMTIKRRLCISNILMILVPVTITFIIVFLSIWAIWFNVMRGTGIGFADSKDFYSASQGIIQLVEASLKYTSNQTQAAELLELSSVLDEGSMSLLVQAEGENFYSYGQSSEYDPMLVNAVADLGGDGFVSIKSRELYAQHLQINQTDYSVLIFRSNTELSYAKLKMMIICAIIILVCGIFLSIFLTNKFLTKFVFQHIEDPLDLISKGVRQIRDGNLDHRIIYQKQDEFAAICSDFNEMAVRLKNSVDITQQQEQNRKQLFAGISHDLRSPLTTIRAYVEGLIDGVAKTPAAQLNYLETIKVKTEEITKMVSMLFMFSKMEYGEYPEYPQYLRLDLEVTQLLQEVGAEYKEKGMVITAAQLIPAYIFADKELLRRILINIVENSVKYKNKPQGSLTITISQHNLGYKVLLSDDGPGVDEKDLPRLFDVFYRSDPARQNPSTGSGLGLAIVANAIHRMNGTCTAQNIATGGLSIELWLPQTNPPTANQDNNYLSEEKTPTKKQKDQKQQ